MRFQDEEVCLAFTLLSSIFLKIYFNAYYSVILSYIMILHNEFSKKKKNLGNSL